MPPYHTIYHQMESMIIVFYYDMSHCDNVQH